MAPAITCDQLMVSGIPYKPAVIPQLRPPFWRSKPRPLIREKTSVKLKIKYTFAQDCLTIRVFVMIGFENPSSLPPEKLIACSESFSGNSLLKKG
jgi:hypothetical protein